MVIRAVTVPLTPSESALVEDAAMTNGRKAYSGRAALVASGHFAAPDAAPSDIVRAVPEIEFIRNQSFTPVVVSDGATFEPMRVFSVSAVAPGAFATKMLSRDTVGVPDPATRVIDTDFMAEFKAPPVSTTTGCQVLAIVSAGIFME